ncbi:MAG TPA: ATP-binding protein [Thermoanaerobaculia bacterium]
MAVTSGHAEQANLNESLGRLAATMAHEFNNVLMSVLQVGEMIGRFYPDDPRLKRMADQLFNATTRGRAITSKILSFSSPAKPVIETFDVSKWLSAHLPELESLGANRGVRLHVQVPEMELRARGDPEQLQQAMVNLVTNACDAMPAGGDLTIALSACDRHVQLRIDDAGMIALPRSSG